MVRLIVQHFKYLYAHTYKLFREFLEMAQTKRDTVCMHLVCRSQPFIKDFPNNSGSFWVIFEPFRKGIHAYTFITLTIYIAIKKTIKNPDDLML